MSLEWLLLASVRRGAVGDVQSILDTGQADVNARDDGGWTSLMRAAANDDAETATILLAAGADPFADDRSGLTAWGLAGEMVKSVLLPAMTVRDERDGKGMRRLDPRHPAVPAGWRLERVSRGRKAGAKGSGQSSGLPCGACGSRPTVVASPAAGAGSASGSEVVRCAACGAVSEYCAVSAKQ